MQFQAKVIREIPGEYVRAGASYTVSREGKTSRHSYHFRNNETGAATFVQPYAFNAAVKSGAVAVQS